LILDTSALLAVLMDEPEVYRFSAAGYVEAAIFVERRGDPLRRAMLDRFVAEYEIRIEPVTVEQAMFARQAFVLFGKGRHKAGLNFGDCFTYALAKAYREPLLFKGGDFGLTDLDAA
jgi:ribonuclease VapC